MNTRFSYRERSVGSGRRRLLVATLCAVFLIIFDTLSGGVVRSIVRSGVASLSSGSYALGEIIFGSGYFTSHAALAKENQSLKEQLAILEERAALGSALQAQITVLAGMAHLAQTVPGITVPIASSFLASPYGTFFIGAGSIEGVSKDALVLSEGGVVLGRVSSVSPHTATVVEIFAAGHAINALVDGASIGVSGRGGGNGSALVPHGVVVAVGDAITVPEFDGRIIGIVGHVDDNPSSAATQIYIGSPVNLATRSYVFVVSGHGPVTP